MDLRRRRQQLILHPFIHLQRGPNQRLCRSCNLASIIILLQPPIQQSCKDGCKVSSVKGGHGDDGEVSEVAVGDGVTPTSGRTHGGDELNVLKRAEAEFFTVVPAGVVCGLAEEFDGGLCAILFNLGEGIQVNGLRDIWFINYNN